jgi:hypothetical protein
VASVQLGKSHTYCALQLVNAVRAPAQAIVLSFTEANNLAGSLPNELRALTALQTLDLYNNSLAGTIPTIVNEFTDLRILDVEQNQLSGPAFVDVSSLTDLQSYRVSLNRLTGTMPNDWSSSSLSSSLQELWFASNNLAGPLPGASIGQLTALSSLILYSNLFTGTLPTELSLLTRLEQLQIQLNAFTSTIPSALYTLTLLNDLRLDNNNFTGTLSSRIGDLVELRDLRMGDNSLTGTLPPQIARLSNLGTYSGLAPSNVCCRATSHSPFVDDLRNIGSEWYSTRRQYSRRL